jgi:hypothetical protein
MRYLFSAPIFSFTLIIFSLLPQIVWAGGDDVNPTDTNTTTVNNSTSVNNSEISPASSISVPQQTGIVQFNNSGSSTLTYPNCGGVCAFGILRLTPNSNGSLNPEAVMGVVVQLSSPEKTYAEAQRSLAQAQSDRITQDSEISILTKLADAVENCQDSRANLLAISAAKSLGLTPEQLLSYAYKQPRKCNLGL